MEGGEKSKGQRSTQCDTNRDEKKQTEETRGSLLTGTVCAEHQFSISLIILRYNFDCFRTESCSFICFDHIVTEMLSAVHTLPQNRAERQPEDERS